MAYVQAGEVFKEIQDIVKITWFNNNSVIPQKAVVLIRSTFPNLASHCGQLQLSVTYKQIVDFLAKYRNSLPTCQDAAVTVQCIKNSFQAELETRTFTFILPTRSGFYSDQVAIGKDIQPTFDLLRLSFKDSCFDFWEAGNCFATERFTACVYHLMRVAEFALVAVADYASETGIAPEESRASWERLIGFIHGRSNKLVSDKVAGFKDKEKMFGDLCSWFTDIKNGWRNPVSHIPRIYNEGTSRGMFTSVGTLFSHLSGYGIVQSMPMPKVPIVLPED